MDERLRHRLRALEPARRILRERGHDHVLDALRQVGPQHARRRRRLIDLRAHHVEDRRARERHAPGHRLEQQHARRVDIGARIDVAGAADLLGRHVRRRAEQRAGLRARRSIVQAGRELRDAEVEHLTRGPSPVTSTLSGLRSRWTMPIACAARERRQHLAHHLHHAARAARCRVRTIARERLALDELHHDERSAVVERRQVEHADDVLVADQVRPPSPRRRTGRAAPASARTARKDLDRDAAADRRLHREIDAAHPALAEQRGDAIPPDLGADQRIVPRAELSHAFGKIAVRLWRPAGTQKTCSSVG